MSPPHPDKPNSSAGQTADPPALCLKCGYDVRFLAGAVCPECGFDQVGPAAVRANVERIPGVRLFWTLLIVCLVTLVEHAIYTGALVGFLMGQSGGWFRYYRDLTRMVWQFNGAVLGLLVVGLGLLTWRATGLRPTARRVAVPLSIMVLASVAGWVLYRLGDDNVAIDILDWQPMWFVNEFRSHYMTGLTSWFSFWEPLCWPMIALGSLHWIVPVGPADRLRPWGGKQDDRAVLWLLTIAVTAAVTGGLGRNARSFTLILLFAIGNAIYTVAMFTFGLAMARRLIAGRNLFNNQGRPARLIDTVAAAGRRFSRR